MDVCFFYAYGELNGNYYYFPLFLVLMQVGNNLPPSAPLITSCTLAKRMPLSLWGVSTCIIQELQVHNDK